MLKLSGMESARRGLRPLRMIADNVPGSVMGETITSLPRGKSRAAKATNRAAVPVATASAQPPPSREANSAQ
ncbi:MAG: hypothetical protein K2Q10_05590 [Rhodospirillales bacterium]|nr:hypothetical protein [Rhodospirillales bacterium]